MDRDNFTAVKVRSACWVAKTYTGFPGTLVPTTTMQFPSANQHSQIPASPHDRCAPGPALVCGQGFWMGTDCSGQPWFYQPAPRHILEERRCRLHGGRNMKCLTLCFDFILLTEQSVLCVHDFLFHRASLANLALGRDGLKWTDLSSEAILWQLT